MAHTPDAALPLIKDDGVRVRLVAGLDLENELWGEVFEPLRDLEQFTKFHIDNELQTLVWPTSADLAPEFLYEACA